jgi:heat shock protein HtpX
VNVYDHIDANNRRTAAILFAFPAALLVLVFLGSYLLVLTGVQTHFKVGVSYFYAISNLMEQTPATFQSSDLERAIYGTPGFWTSALGQTIKLTLSIYPWMILVAAVWIIISYYKGGAMILRMARARAVKFDDDRELFRLVENTAIMAGLPTPKIYFIEDEALNAFATGREPKTASIALTKGMVSKLDKAELQAAIAHELAHIGNRDTRLMMITVAGIGCFTFFGELILRGSGRGR